MAIKNKNSLFFGLKENMTDEQEEYLDALMNPDISLIIVDAPAGTGKTTIAVGAAKLLCSSGKYNSMFYTFAPVEENAIGFTPGEVFEKEQKYHGPLIDALIAIREEPKKAIFNPLAIAKEENKNINSKSKKKSTTTQNECWITAASHTFLRGTNLSHKVIIIDEAQNFTKRQLQKVLTRCHDTCKVILIGHQGQCDIPENTSGFKDYIEHAKSFEKGRIITLTKSFRGRLAEWADSI